ncbi:MAG: DNA-binding response regulator [Armatimonadetes bacterium RBG_16_58_9]|nr:MAG: DNA-binding response regulator [Armatimonadetes bacterium RBG_16_58_9]
MPAKIIVVEDEEDIAALIRHNLESEGYRVEVCEDGISALEAVRREAPDLMLLDIMLPGLDGKEVCRIVRREHDFPIIMLSARTTEFDKVIGLEMGADDYIAKPFGMLELVARVRSALRRASGESKCEESVLKGGDITLDRARHICKVNDTQIELRPKEFALLETLLSGKGRVFDRAALLERVWGEAEYIDHGTVDVHVRRLREKIEEDPSRPRHVVTVRGIGYKFGGEGS